MEFAKLLIWTSGMVVFIFGSMHGVIKAQGLNQTSPSNLDGSNSSTSSQYSSTTASSTSIAKTASTSNTTVNVIDSSNVTNTSNTTGDKNITSSTAQNTNGSITPATILENNITTLTSGTNSTAESTWNITVGSTTVSTMKIIFYINTEVDKDLIIAISVGGVLFAAMLIFVIVYCRRQASRTKFMKKQVKLAKGKPLPTSLPKFT